jgi:hypothetical protein
MSRLITTIEVYDDGSSKITDHRPAASGNGWKPRPVTIEGVNYDALNEASKALGLSRYIILTRCGSDQFPDWRLL